MTDWGGVMKQLCLLIPNPHRIFGLSVLECFHVLLCQGLCRTVVTSEWKVWCAFVAPFIDCMKCLDSQLIIVFHVLWVASIVILLLPDCLAVNLIASARAICSTLMWLLAILFWFLILLVFSPNSFLANMRAGREWLWIIRREFCVEMVCLFWDRLFRPIQQLVD